MRVAHFAAGHTAILWVVADGFETSYHEVAYLWTSPDLFAGLHRLEAKNAVRQIEQRVAEKQAKMKKFGSQWKR